MIFRVILQVGYRDAWFDFDTAQSALSFLLDSHNNFVASDDCEKLKGKLIVIDKEEEIEN